MNLKNLKLLKILYVFIALVVAVLLVLFLLHYHPSNYPVPPQADSSESPAVTSNPSEPATDTQVSPYLTHILSPQIYNGAQSQQPFDVIVTQQGVNDIVTRSKWSKKANGITFNTPQVFFAPNGIVLIDQAVFDDSDFTVTIVGKPVFDKNRLLNLRITNIKVGALTVTSLAKIIVAGCYKDAVPEINSAKNDWPEKIAASLLNDKPFDPTFEIDHKKIRIDNITLADRQLIIHFIPAGG